MRLPFLLLALPLCALGTEKALVLDATWDRFSQHTALRYTHLGAQTRLETVPAKPADAYLLVDTARDQRITVYRHNSSWRLDPLEPKPRPDSPAGAPDLPRLPQPPPGIGPQGQIGPRTSPGGGAAAMPPTPGYEAGAPDTSGTIGPRGPIGPRPGPEAAAPTQPAESAMPAMPPRPQMPAAPAPGYGAGAAAMPGAGMGTGFGGGMPMPPPSAMPGREPAPTLTKTGETQTILGRTAAKFTLSGRMMETVEIWAVPDADFGPFFAYRPQPPHRFGPRELEEEWDSVLRKEHLFPLLAVFQQGDREIARFTVATIAHAEVAEPATFFAPPPTFYRCPPDPF